MECEICGRQVSDNPKKAKIEGSVMIVCDECAKLGKIQKAPPKPKFRKSNKPKKNKTTKQNYSKDEPKEELVEDFNVKIRKARESKNLSREELGQKIYEKVSVINRIESGKMIPDIRLTKKLENALNITLIENDNKLCAEVASELDALVVCGNGTNSKILEEVNIEDAKYFIATTGNDEANLLSCILVRKYKVKHIIARVSNPDHEDYKLIF